MAHLGCCSYITPTCRMRMKLKGNHHFREGVRTSVIQDHPPKQPDPTGTGVCLGCSPSAQGAEAGGLPIVLMMQPHELQHGETPSSCMAPTSVSQDEH